MSKESRARPDHADLFQLPDMRLTEIAVLLTAADFSLGENPLAERITLRRLITAWSLEISVLMK